MITALVMVLIYLLIIALIGWVAVYIIRAVGVFGSMTEVIVKIVWVIVAIAVLLVLVQRVLPMAGVS